MATGSYTFSTRHAHAQPASNKTVANIYNPMGTVQGTMTLEGLQMYIMPANSHRTLGTWQPTCVTAAAFMNHLLNTPEFNADGSLNLKHKTV